MFIAPKNQITRQTRKGLLFVWNTHGFDTLRKMKYNEENRFGGKAVTIIHNKLVRDRIPEIIEASGKTCSIRILSDEEYIAALDAKLQEELNEYLSDGSMEELADLLEVMMAAAKARGHDFNEVEAIRREKADKRGGFGRRIWLGSVTEGR